jgi:enoyl-CoA hydratase/carnithine racemase
MPTWTLERRGAVALLTFTRPPRNFMSFASMTELEGMLEPLAADESTSVVVLTGGVPGYFIAHADLEDLTRVGRGDPVDGDPGSWRRVLDLLESMPQPVVAAVNGQAHGGGSELCWACTIRLIARSGHFGQPEVNVGIIPGAGGTQRLPRLIGASRAADLVLTGRRVDATEALATGLAAAVLPDENFVEHAVAWAEQLAAKPRPALVAGKRAIVEGMRLPIDEALRLEGRLFMELQLSADAQQLEEQAIRRYAEAPPGEAVCL